METNNRQKYITPSLTPSILPWYCDCAGKVQSSLHLHPIHLHPMQSFFLLSVTQHARKYACPLLPQTYDCHLKESERSLTFLLLFLQEWPVVWHLVRNTSQAISPLLSSVILALYVSLLSIQIFDFLNSAGRVLQYHS